MLFFDLLNNYIRKFQLIPLLDLDEEGPQQKPEKNYGETILKEQQERISRFEGGLISEEHPVPNVVTDPSERINPITGMPYDSEAERLGFEEGGLLVSIGIAPVSEKQTDKLKNVLKTRRTKMHGGGHLLKHKLKKRLTA